MKIVVNEINEIVSYCNVGNLENSIETIKTFPSKFDKGKFIYNKENDEILENPFYVEDRVSKELEIIKFKKLLSDTDYKAIKYAEGFISEEEYTETKLQRQEWRNKINQIEKSLQ